MAQCGMWHRMAKNMGLQSGEHEGYNETSTAKTMCGEKEVGGRGNVRSKTGFFQEDRRSHLT